MGRTITIAAMIFIAALLATNNHAIADEYNCSEAAQLIGDPRGPFKLPAQCRQWAFESASEEQKIFFNGGEIKTVAGPNYIVTYRPEIKPLNPDNKQFEELLIAGEETLLKNIQSFSVNRRLQTMTVVDGNNSIKTFNYLNQGNIAPLHHLQTEEVEGASFAVSNEKMNQLAVAFPENGLIKFFQIQADINGRRPENSTKLLRTLDTASLGMPKPSHLAFDPIKEELIIYDKINRNVVRVLWAKKLKVISSISKFNKNEAPERIDFHDNEKSLAGLDNKGNLKFFDQDMKVRLRRPANQIDWQDQYQTNLKLQKKLDEFHNQKQEMELMRGSRRY